ncbi:MAG: glycoside hydrolase family 15 protein [Salinigranum sp.]
MASSDATAGRPSDKDAIVSAPSGAGKTVLSTINQYPGPSGRNWHGALIEETSAFRSDVELFLDLHVLLWDANLGHTVDVRNDAVASEVRYESPRVPETHVENDFEFETGYGAELSQDVIVAVDAPALLVRNEVAFERPNEHTLYTLAGLGIVDHERPDNVDEAYVHHGEACDAVIAHDEDRYLALAQKRPETGNARFDGHRIGRKGRASGPEKSAWHDIYVEDDGYIDANERLSGSIDAGVGLYAGTDRQVRWLTAVGFGRSEETALGAAERVLDNGYEAERDTFADAWEAWHRTHAPGPTGDDVANRLYDLSLTSLKCAQDPRGAIIAGAFKPRDAEYKYVWPRDLTIIVQALLSAGATREARGAMEWLAEAQITESTCDARGIDRKGTWWQNYFVDWTPHWRSLQLDQVGGPIYAHWLLWRETGDDSVRDEFYETSRLAAEFLLGWDDDGFPKRHQDAWEETWGRTTAGSAAAVAGLRAMADLAAARGDDEFAARCRERAETWASGFREHCFATGTPFGDHYVTAGDPEYGAEPPADRRPDAAAFMAVWPWNVVRADEPGMRSTADLAAEPPWRATGTPCVGRYPGDDYTPSGTVEDGGWPLCEAYADVVRWLSGADEDAVERYVFEDAAQWTTAAGLLPERVDGHGDVRWNSNLQWSQAAYVLLAESQARGVPYGMAPGETATKAAVAVDGSDAAGGRNDAAARRADEEVAPIDADVDDGGHPGDGDLDDGGRPGDADVTDGGRSGEGGAGDRERSGEGDAGRE